MEPIALWTIRCSIACYLVAVSLQIRHRSPIRLCRLAWTAGAVLCVVHVITAMAGFHDFSHAESVRHTAEVTRRVVGVNWGGGVYVNYFFTLLWCVDAIQQWRRPQRCTPIWIHVFMAFIVFNATFVFGPIWWRYTTVPIVLMLAVAWRHRARSDRNSDSTEAVGL